MGNAQPRSYTRLVLANATKNTRRTLGSWLWDAIGSAVIIVFGFVVYSTLLGVPNALQEVVSAFLFSSLPMLGAALIAVFVWHLVLAPSELAYEMSREALAALAARAAPAPMPIAAPESKIWRLRSSYSVRELAALLENIDPNSGQTTPNAIALQRLILESMEDGQLPYQKEFTSPGYLSRESRELTPDAGSMISKKAAIDWAGRQGFDVSRFE